MVVGYANDIAQNIVFYTYNEFKGLSVSEQLQYINNLNYLSFDKSFYLNSLEAESLLSIANNLDYFPKFGVTIIRIFERLSINGKSFYSLIPKLIDLHYDTNNPEFGRALRKIILTHISRADRNQITALITIFRKSIPQQELLLRALAKKQELITGKKFELKTTPNPNKLFYGTLRAKKDGFLATEQRRDTGPKRTPSLRF